MTPHRIGLKSAARLSRVSCLSLTPVDLDRNCKIAGNAKLGHVGKNRHLETWPQAG